MGSKPCCRLLGAAYCIEVACSVVGLQVFFCKYNDPIYVKMEKLEIMIKLASEKNIDQVLLEFKEYAQEVDVDFVRKVRSAGCDKCPLLLHCVASLDAPTLKLTPAVPRHSCPTVAGSPAHASTPATCYTGALHDSPIAVAVPVCSQAVRAIGRCAVSLEKAAQRCISVLLELIQTKVNYVVQEAVIVIKVSWLHFLLLPMVVEVRLHVCGSAPWCGCTQVCVGLEIPCRQL